MIKRVFSLFRTLLYYKLVFKEIGIRSVILSPLKLEHPQNIKIGNHVYIAYKSWLAAAPQLTNSKSELIINDGCRIGNFNHIYATTSIILEKNVLTADKVYISDNLHQYENIHLPIWKQPIKQLAKVIIGEGAWIGENVCIIGASVGKNSVIGANSTVTKDIPAYCVAVGSPAKVIKRFCVESQTWKKTDQYGKII